MSFPILEGKSETGFFVLLIKLENSNSDHCFLEWALGNNNCIVRFFIGLYWLKKINNSRKKEKHNR